MKSERKKRLKSFETQTLIKKRREEERGMYLVRKEERSGKPKCRGERRL